MSEYTYRISLRIKHPNVDPALVAAQLGWKLRASWLAGSQRLSPSGQPLGIADHSYCNFTLDHSSNASLVDALKVNLQYLSARKEFMKELTSTGGKLEFYVGWFVEHHAGEVLEAKLLRELGELGIDLTLEVYGPDQKALNAVVLDFNRPPPNND
jgi:hypothetical protein